MPNKIIKLDVEKCNEASRFKLENEDEGVNLIFKRDTLRGLLEGLGYSSHKIGHVYKLLNKKFPLDVKKYKVSNEERFSVVELIEYVGFYGLKVKKRDRRINLKEAIQMLEDRGYEVSGNNEAVSYLSPLLNKN